jgi:hypothetical protein
MKRQPSILYLIAAFVLITGLPYIVAYISAGENFVFGGFLLNPIDGNSYLAKMYLGWSGDWQFTLPFTAEKGDGSFIFLFYLFLGHVSRWIGAPPILVFHFARLAGAAYLFLMLVSFSNRIFNSSTDDRMKAVLLAGFGSGVGWLAIPAGHFTSDFWVAEAYPFLSAYATPHFAVGLGLVLNLFIISMLPPSKKSILSLFVLSFLLAIIQPFGVVVAGLVIGITIFWNGWRARKWDWQILMPVLVGGGLPLLYQYWIIMTDPHALTLERSKPYTGSRLVGSTPFDVAGDITGIFCGYKKNSWGRPAGKTDADRMAGCQPGFGFLSFQPSTPVYAWYVCSNRVSCCMGIVKPAEATVQTSLAAVVWLIHINQRDHPYLRGFLARQQRTRLCI